MARKPNIIWSPWPGSQQKFLSCPVWECLLEGPRGGGKCVKSSSYVATDTGWRRIDSLSISDMVYGQDAKLYPVTGVFPQGKKTEYKLTLQDGREVISGDEHLWLVKDKILKDKVVSTIEMYEKGITTGQGRSKCYKYRIPNCEPLHWKEKVLPIKPYFLGCLISEGTLTTRTPKIATSNKFILDMFKEEFSEFEFSYDKSTQNNYTIVDIGRGGISFPNVPKRDKHGRRNRLTEALEYLKINVKCHDKFIPEIYKHGSIQQRLDLLSGLMDTDGCISCTGYSEFTSASKQLVNDFAYVARSLGIRCKIGKDKRVNRKIEIRGKTYTSGLIYRVYINTSMVLAKDPQKVKNALKKKTTNASKYVSIVKVEKLNKKSDMICIAVNSPDHTYIIEDFIVTHNTDSLIMDFAQEVGKGHGADYKGVILRQATTELGDVIAKTKKWIPRIFPLAKYNGTTKTWTFPDGEVLWLTYARTDDDYYRFHGQQIQYFGFEELTNWPTPSLYLKLMSCNRSSVPGIPLKYRSTCNPSGPGHCVPYGEVLTPTGWKDIWECKLNDPVFTVDKNGQLKLSKVEQFHQMKYTGEMVSVRKRGLNLNCTPEHRMPKLGGTSKTRGSAFTLLPFNELPNQAYILRSVKWEGEDLPGFKPKIYPTRKRKLKQPSYLSIEHFAEFMGWFISEGYVVDRDKTVGISQTKPQYRKAIKFLLDKCGFVQSWSKIGVLLCAPDHWNYFRRFGKCRDKFIPTQLKKAKPEILRILFNALMKGDGHWTNNEPDNGALSGEYYTTSKQLSDDVSEIALKLGYCVYTSFRQRENRKGLSYTVYFKTTDLGCSIIQTGMGRYSNRSQFDHSDVELIPFDGQVCCIGVKNTNSFILRQKGTVWISGNSWVKQRFIDVAPAGKIYNEEINFEYPDKNGKMIQERKIVQRTRVQSFTSENKSLMEADPLYMAKISALTQDNEMLRKAWIEGSWDLLMGGFFTDVWDHKIHVINTFQPPKSWKLIRSFDWGSSRPWAVTYGFETNGEQPDVLPEENIPYIPKGSVIICNEIYGWNGNANEGDMATSQEIAERVLLMDNSMLTEYGLRTIPGPADTSIYAVQDGTSIGANLSTHGCRWTKAYKGPGSRIAGWAIIRQMLGAAKRGALETPHLYFFPQAQHHIRTLPLLQRDKVRPEDVFSDSEDHCFVYDTEIITENGIEKIGDLVNTTGKVLSVNGNFVPYKNCRLTQKQVNVIQVTFSDGYSVVCTSDHKFLTTKGFIKAKNLLILLDTYCILSQPKKIKGGSLCENELEKFKFCQKQNKNLTEKLITNAVITFKKMAVGFTELFGCVIKEKFQKGFMYITKMKINPIINLKTWLYCTTTNIYHYTKQDIKDQSQNKLWMQRQSGIKVQKEKNGITNIMKTQKRHYMKK